jgi:hypothetical protein
MQKGGIGISSGPIRTAPQNATTLAVKLEYSLIGRQATSREYVKKEFYIHFLDTREATSIMST